VLKDHKFHLFYRAVAANGISSIGHAIASTDMKMAERSENPVLAPREEWEELGCEDARITQIHDAFHALYTAYSRRGPRIALASSADLNDFTKIGLIGPDMADKDAVLFPETINGSIAMIHRIDPSMQIAYFEDSQFDKLADESFRSQYWAEHLRNLDAHEIMSPRESWEKKKIGVGPPPIRTAEGWLIVYHGVDDNYVYRAGVALADIDDPQKILARSRTPILEPTAPYEKYGLVPEVVFPEAAIVLDGDLYVFYGAADTVSCVATAHLDELLRWLVQQC
jgi:predicted GH43/DUF377 family glycosyl hydrolase